MARHIYGVGPVRELLAASRATIKAIYVEPARAAKAGKDPVAELAAAARAAGVRVEDRSRAELDRLAGPEGRHQGVIAVCADVKYADVAELLARAEAAGEPALIVILDGIQDPHNLGAIVRSAYVLGAHGVLIPEHRAAAVTPAATKASAGATELLPIAMVGNLARALDELKAAGVWTCAVASGPGARPLAEVLARIGATTPLAIVLGAEGSGVRPLVAKTCDFHAEIPMAGQGVGSLNVSVAAGIALYEARRLRASAVAPG